MRTTTWLLAWLLLVASIRSQTVWSQSADPYLLNNLNSINQEVADVDLLGFTPRDVSVPTAVDLLVDPTVAWDQRTAELALQPLTVGTAKEPTLVTSPVTRQFKLGDLLEFGDGFTESTHSALMTAPLMLVYQITHAPQNVINPLTLLQQLYAGTVELGRIGLETDDMHTVGQAAGNAFWALVTLKGVHDGLYSSLNERLSSATPSITARINTALTGLGRLVPQGNLLAFQPTMVLAGGAVITQAATLVSSSALTAGAAPVLGLITFNAAPQTPTAEVIRGSAPTPASYAYTPATPSNIASLQEGDWVQVSWPEAERFAFSKTAYVRFVAHDWPMSIVTDGLLYVSRKNRDVFSYWQSFEYRADLLSPDYPANLSQSPMQIIGIHKVR